MSENQSWTAVKERGNLAGMKILLFIYRHGGKYLMFPIMYLVVAYFFLSNASTRRNSKRYLERIQKVSPYPVKANNWTSLKHYLTFASTLFDRISAWTNDFDHTIFDFPKIEEFLSFQEKGVVLLGAHLGNLDMCRAVAMPKDFSATIHVILNSQHTAQFNELIKDFKSHVEYNLISTHELTPATAIDLKTRLDGGDYLIILADRVSQGSEKTIEASFLGDPIQLPAGSFRFAISLEHPVYFLACVKRKGRHFFELKKLLDSDQPGSKKQKLKALADTYVNAMTELCKEYPLQWFNFYDYWNDDSNAVNADQAGQDQPAKTKPSAK